MKFFTSKNNGFSLVETLVAITILSIIIVGPMTISSSAARSTSFSSEQVIAFFLAQEGAEIAQKARDDLILNDFATDPQTGWDAFSDDDVLGSGKYKNCFVTVNPDGCGLGLETDAVATVKPAIDCGSANCQLYYKAGNGRSRYTYTAVGADKKTPYTRTIKFERVGADQIKVTSKVTWRTGSQRKSQEVSVETYLFNVYGS
jgi:prepilin-type N-terminal cleavage/methylation domain-containing protein